MFSKWSISKKLTIMSTLLGVVPLIIIAIIINIQVSKSVTTEAFNKLDAIGKMQQNSIQRWFHEQFLIMEVYAKSEDVHQVYTQLQKYHIKHNVADDANYPINTQEFKELWQANSSFFLDAQKKFGYYDMFVICAEHGHVMYSNGKESDLGQNLKYGDLKDSGLAKIWQKVVASGSDAIIDYSSYAPSNGDPASFIGSPIKDTNGTIIGVLAIQISDKVISTITQERHGLGKSGETYLIGMDKKMRSNSFLDPINRSVKASFNGSVSRNGIDTQAANEIIAGRSGTQIITDYMGNSALSDYAPLNIKDLKWGIITELDEAEALASTYKLETIIIVVTIISAVVIALIALFFASGFARPIKKIADELIVATENLDLSKRIQVDSKDEIGTMANSLNNLFSKVAGLISETKGNADNLSAAAVEISATTEQMSHTINEQNKQSQTVGAATEELSVTSNDIAQSIDNTLINAQNSSKMTKNGGAVIQESITSFAVIKNNTESLNVIIQNLANSTNDISGLISVINDIASQTNLLALNAAIEAARAGEYGRGFAVVADEVRNLAKRTGDAVSNVEKIISGLQVESEQASSSMQEMSIEVENGTAKGEQSIAMLEKIVTGSDEIVTATHSIATIVGQQNDTINEISNSIQTIVSGAQESSSAISESARTAESLAKQAEDLMQSISIFKT